MIQESRINHYLNKIKTSSQTNNKIGVVKKNLPRFMTSNKCVKTEQTQCELKNLDKNEFLEFLQKKLKGVQL